MSVNPLFLAQQQQNAESDAKEVVQGILDAANKSRSVSGTTKDGHKSLEKIMSEAALKLKDAGKGAAVKFLNDFRAQLEGDPDYTAQGLDVTPRNRLARKLGFKINHMGAGKKRGVRRMCHKCGLPK
jgi:hypothetical protein